MKVNLTGTVVGPAEIIPDFDGVLVYEFIFQIADGQNPFAGILPVSFPVRVADGCILFQGDRLEVFGILEAIEHDESPGKFFYGCSAETVKNLTRHSTWHTCCSALWEDEE